MIISINGSFLYDVVELPSLSQYIGTTIWFKHDGSLHYSNMRNWCLRYNEVLLVET